MDKQQEIIASVEEFFKRDAVKYVPFDERGVARATYGLQSKIGHVEIFFYAQADKLQIRTLLPINAGENERAKVGECILRANYGLQVGGFDFDFDDGEISYRISIYCGDEEFSPPTYEQINYALVLSLMMADKYGDALLKVIFGLAEPKDAVEAAEAND